MPQVEQLSNADAAYSRAGITRLRKKAFDKAFGTKATGKGLKLHREHLEADGVDDVGSSL